MGSSAKVRKRNAFFCHSLDVLLVHTKEINVPLLTYFNNGMKGNEKIKGNPTSKRAIFLNGSCNKAN